MALRLSARHRDGKVLIRLSSFTVSRSEGSHPTLFPGRGTYGSGAASRDLKLTCRADKRSAIRHFAALDGGWRCAYPPYIATVRC